MGGRETVSMLRMWETKRSDSWKKYRGRFMLRGEPPGDFKSFFGFRAGQPNYLTTFSMHAR